VPRLSLFLKDQPLRVLSTVAGIWEKSRLPLWLSGLVGNRSAWFGAEAASACGYERAALRRGIKSIIKFESVLAEIRELSIAVALLHLALVCSVLTLFHS